MPYHSRRSQSPKSTNPMKLAKSAQFSRRRFLRGSATAVSLAGLGYWSGISFAEGDSPNGKLDIAFIGTANQARFSIGNLTSQNLVAFCDVDENALGKAGMDFPKAKLYRDYRKMLDEPGFDAVVICTPDHVHAPATMAAIRRGKHVYCEKPLTHTVAEARAVTEAAAKAGVATQMGTQIHSDDNYRRVVELIRGGAIGDVQEVHTFAASDWTAKGRPEGTPPVPESMHWDLWLGPAAERPYNAAYHPMGWRKYWEFGGGTLTDLACHHMDLPFWALGLRYPSRIEAEGPPVDAEGCSTGIKVSYTYAAEGEQPACKLTWYDGPAIPKEIAGAPCGGGGNIFVGSRGVLRADYGSWKLFPEADFADFKPPSPTIASSPGHHAEWIAACKGGTPALCNFNYAGPLTEAVLLGAAAYRSGSPIEWNAAELKITNNPAAEKWLSKEYRPGWGLDG